MIESITRATDEEWDSMVNASETAIYDQTREWSEIWCESAGFRNDTRLITFASGKKVLLPLCYRVFLGGLLRIHFLVPKGDGGFVTNDFLDDNEKGELFWVLRQVRNVYARLHPFDTLTNQFDGPCSTDTTQVMDLSEGFENTFKKWSRDNRRRTKRGLAQGMTVELASTENDWRSYYSLYQEALTRWGGKATNAYGWPLFQAMFSRNSSKIRLWLAKYHGQLIAGAICFYHNRLMLGWHTARTMGLQQTLDPFHVLQYYITKDACERDFLLYDFGSSGDLEGVVNFKSGFATEFRTVRVYKSRLLRISTAVRRLLRKHPATRFLMRGIGS